MRIRAHRLYRRPAAHRSVVMHPTSRRAFGEGKAAAPRGSLVANLTNTRAKHHEVDWRERDAMWTSQCYTGYRQRDERRLRPESDHRCCKPILD